MFVEMDLLAFFSYIIQGATAKAVSISNFQCPSISSNFIFFLSNLHQAGPGRSACPTFMALGLLKWQHQCPILEWAHHLPAIAFHLQAHTNMCSSCQAICILHALNSSQAFGFGIFKHYNFNL